MESSKIVIVGAGPSGLAVAGRLTHLGITDYIILESSQRVGNAWHNHYDRLHLHTVKQWSHLPHMPFPDDYPLYVPRKEVVAYLEHYAEKFNIMPRFNHTVEQIEKNGDGWVVHTEKTDIHAQHVVVASGVNKMPHIPHWHGQDSFKGEIIHSRFYKNPLPYKNKRVLIIGMGNTGAEIAFDLSEHDVDVHLAVRSAISLVPRDLNGQPVQVTARRLAKFPFGIGDWLGSQIRKIYFGNLEKYGLPISKMHPAVQLRETGKTPVIDIGTIAAIKKRKIKVHPNIKKFKEGFVQFEDGQEELFDSIILATGYKANLEKLIAEVSSFLDNHKLPKGVMAEGELSNLYFIGFDNYKVGGILGTIHSDSEKIVNKLISEN